jgi:hypothetical protein
VPIQIDSSKKKDNETGIKKIGRKETPDGRTG